ncbi:MAG: PKD domain-containing protein [Kangiellaceae bacterium]|nr:PKD domain-containing protein [Kangiellaceae bacterium]
MQLIFSRFFIFVILIQMVACGGGGPDPVPVANAGQNQQVKVGDVVQLDARLSRASTGSLTYFWRINEQPVGSSIAISNADNVNAFFITDQQGEYKIELTVTDNNGQSATSVITITADAINENSIPVARITADKLVTNTGQLIVLNGDTSSDADNDPLSYAWTLLQQPAASNAEFSAEIATQVSFSADAEGSYLIGLKVSDDNSSHETSIELTLDNGNHAPVAVAGDDQVITLGENVLLNGSASYDDENDALTFEWSFANQPVGSGSQLNNPLSEDANFTPDVAGDYLLRLRVSDSNSYSEYDLLLVTVNANQPPTAVAGDDRQVETGKTVILDAIASSDPEDDNLTYAWEFVEKPVGHDTTLHFADTQTPEFDTYLEGIYIVKLAVNDGYQDSMPDTITIESKRNHLPIAAIDGETEQHGVVNQRITLNGANSSDPEGVALIYQWTLTAVENSSAVLENDTDETASFTPDLAGVYLVKLVVSDDSQESHYDLVRITVYPAEEMVDVSVSGTLLDHGDNPLDDILVYREGAFDSATSDINGDFTFDFKVPKSMLSSVELVLADSNQIPRTLLSIIEFTEVNTTVDVGVRNLPRLQRKDLFLWACNSYSGPEDVDVTFNLAPSEYDDIHFEYNETMTFTPQTLSYLRYLPATATIAMSSEAAKVTVGINDTEWVHQYQFNDDTPDSKIIDVCDKE